MTGSYTFDENVSAPGGGTRERKVRDLVLAIVAVAGAILFVTKVDGAGGNCRGGIAPCSHTHVMAVVVVAAIAEGVAEVIDRLASRGECVKGGLGGGDVKA